jgi:hypothetical protein
MNTQSLNRYAYVWNNPLRYNDPSGYFLKELVNIGIAIFRVAALEAFSPLAWAHIIYATDDLAGEFGSNRSDLDIAFENSRSLLIGASWGAFNSRASGDQGVDRVGYQPRSSASWITRSSVGSTSSRKTGDKFRNGASTRSFALAANTEDSWNREEMIRKAERGEVICSGSSCIVYGVRDVWRRTSNPEGRVVWRTPGKYDWVEYAGVGARIPVAGVSVEGTVQYGVTKYEHRRYRRYYQIRVRDGIEMEELQIDLLKTGHRDWRVDTSDTFFPERDVYRLCSSVGTRKGCTGPIPGNPARLF